MATGTHTANITRQYKSAGIHRHFIWDEKIKRFSFQGKKKENIELVTLAHCSGARKVLQPQKEENKASDIASSSTDFLTGIVQSVEWEEDK